MNILSKEYASVIALHEEKIYSHSQPIYDDNNNAVDFTEVIQEKSDLPLDKIVNRHQKKYKATRIKYSVTRIKSRNVLSNTPYTTINKNNFYNENFILDIYVLLVKNLNSFSLSRKVTNKIKQDMVYMLWKECILSKFYKYICDDKNFKFLNGHDVGHRGVPEIVRNFMDK